VQHRVITSDGVELSLLRFARNVQWNVPILLTHGTLSNALVCARLASSLADQGFDAWILEWRGHGQSARGDARPDFQYLADFDVPAGIAAVQQATQRKEIFLVGHSGGGLVFLMHLARQREKSAFVRGIVTIASQATEAGHTWRDKAKIASFAAVNNTLGHLPGPMLGLGPENEWREVMNQWFRWNLSRRWLARAEFDYAQALGEIDVPLLCLADAGDRFIAPVRGCLRLYETVGSRDKRFVLCGKSDGFSEDYDHTRIIASRAADQEIWPIISEWLRKRL
jgi:oxygen-independent coproporphyrinogen-3 oxidase